MLNAWSTLMFVLFVGTIHFGWWIVALVAALLATVFATRWRDEGM